MYTLPEIWKTYWGSKGKCHNQFWGKSDQPSRSYKQFTFKAKSNFCHAYVSCFKEKTENWYVVRLNIRGVPLVIRK